MAFSLHSNSSVSLQVGELRQVRDGEAKESGLQPEQLNILCICARYPQVGSHKRN